MYVGEGFDRVAYYSCVDGYFVSSGSTSRKCTARRGGGEGGGGGAFPPPPPPLEINLGKCEIIRALNFGEDLFIFYFILFFYFLETTLIL